MTPALLANCVLLGTSGGHLQVHHICLKKYLSSSRQFLAKIFVKNNHSLVFLQGLSSTSGVNTAFFFSKISEYQCFAVCCPETSSCASKPLLLRCKLVIPQCLGQASLGLKEVHTMFRCVPKLALVPASRYYCYVN